MLWVKGGVLWRKGWYYERMVWQDKRAAMTCIYESDERSLDIAAILHACTRARAFSCMLVRAHVTSALFAKLLIYCISFEEYRISTTPCMHEVRGTAAATHAARPRRLIIVVSRASGLGLGLGLGLGRSRARYQRSRQFEVADHDLRDPTSSADPSAAATTSAADGRWRCFTAATHPITDGTRIFHAGRPTATLQARGWPAVDPSDLSEDLPTTKESGRESLCHVRACVYGRSV